MVEAHLSTENLSFSGLNGCIRYSENFWTWSTPLTSCSNNGNLTTWKSSYRSSICKIDISPIDKQSPSKWIKYYLGQELAAM